MRCVLTAHHKGRRDKRKLEGGKSGFIQVPTFVYKLPYYRHLNPSILTLMYFIIESFGRSRDRCSFDVIGEVLGAKCPLYLVFVPQRQIRLLCTSLVVLPFHSSSAVVNQNSLGIEAEGQWSQDTGMQIFVCSACLHFLMATILGSIIT